MVLPLSCVVTLCCPVVKSFYFLPFGGLSLDMLVQHTYRQFNNSGVSGSGQFPSAFVKMTYSTHATGANGLQ